MQREDSLRKVKSKRGFKGIERKGSSNKDLLYDLGGKMIGFEILDTFNMV